MIEQFKHDVKKGLSANSKFLSSKYFYDKVGDDLFVQIMNMPEYYLTRAEFEIFSKKTEELIAGFDVEKNTYFELIELGAGDGTKTKELLKVLTSLGYNYSYSPIDISQNALNSLESSLSKELPHVNVQTKQGDYFEVLSSLKDTSHKKVVLFLGSNIGNLTDDLSAKFIYELGSNLNPKDNLLLGVDLIKEVDRVLPAYNDSAGITAKFNLNLLNRINKELGGNFDLQKFAHQPEYTVEEGIAKSYIVSLTSQEVEVSCLNETFTFKEGEKIHTEVSRKYNDEVINKILSDTDFTIEQVIKDSSNSFADYILKRN